MEVHKLADHSVSDEFNNLQSDRHKRAKPPKEAYLFFPSGNDLFTTLESSNSNNIVRRIFEGPTEYLEIEKQHITALKKELRKMSPNLEMFLEDCLILRFLQASRNDYQRTLDMILDHLKWKESIFPIRINENIRKILNSGFIYVHGRDCRYRPIIVLNPNIYVENSGLYQYEDWMNSITYLMDYLVKYCLIPGQVENWSIICNVVNSNILFLPKDLKQMIETLSRNFAGRLYAMYVINVSFFVWTIWNGVKILLDPITQTKIKLYSEKEISSELFKFINKKQVEKKLGGLAEDVNNDYFPPIFPNDEYLLPFENKDNILITEDQYIEKIKKNKKISISPYIYLMNNKQNKKEGKFEEGISLLKLDSVYEDAYSRYSEMKLEKQSKYEECNEKQSLNNHPSVYEDMNPESKQSKKDENEVNLRKNSKEEIILIYSSEDTQKSNCNNSFIIVQNPGEKLDKTAEKSCDSAKNQNNQGKLQEMNSIKSMK